MTNELKALLAKNNVKTSFHQFYYKMGIPNIPINKKIFIIYYGKLTACVIKDLVYGCTNADSWFAHARIAGVGNILINLGDYFGVSGCIRKWWNDIDEYLDFCNGNTSAIHKLEESSNQLFVDTIARRIGCTRYNRVPSTWNHTLVMFGCKKGETEAHIENPVIELFWIDEHNNIHIEWNGKDNYGNDVYPTSKEAVRKAMITDVVDFSDEVTSDTLAEVEINITIKATTKEDALEEIIKELDKKFA